MYVDLFASGIKPLILNLEGDKIPDTVEIIGIIGGIADFSDFEYNRLKEFQKRGGNIVVAKQFGEKSKPTPNFDELLSSYGLTLKDGNVLDFNPKNRMRDPQGNALNNVIRPLLSERSVITKDIAKGGETVRFFYPTKIDVDDEKKLKEKNVTIENLVYTSDKAQFIKNLKREQEKAEKPKGDTARYILGTMATKDMGNGKKSKAVVYSNYFFMTDWMFKDLTDKESIMYDQNLKLTINSFIALHSKSKEYIDLKKGVQSTYYLSTDFMQRDFNVTILVLAIPIVIILGVGTYIFFKRRNNNR